MILTIMNCKGGVGKSTLAVELSLALARFAMRRVLLIDVDPQASASLYLLPPERWQEFVQVAGSTYAVFSANPPRLPRLSVGGIELAPAQPVLFEVDVQEPLAHDRLLMALSELKADYDYILIDCPPTFNPVTKNALWASHAYLVPTVPDFLSTYGIQVLQHVIAKWVHSLPSPVPLAGPAFGGIIFNRVRPVNEHRAYQQQVLATFPGKVFAHGIGESIAIAEAQTAHVPICLQKKQSDLQRHFRLLAEEVRARLGG